MPALVLAAGAIVLSAVAWIVGLTLHHFYLYILFLRSSIQRQRPSPARWPSVTIQAPVYNESGVLQRLLRNLKSVEYTGQLEIQILDDSTDSSGQREFADRARQQVEHAANWQWMRRDHRAGYKAGALEDGMLHARGELILVLDADFELSPTFLRRMVRHIALSENVAMVQARWRFSNRDRSWLTRAQAIGIEQHFLVEQVARASSGLLTGFNGSAGLWRKEAILESGGWQSDTLTEDVDLSYRAQFAGWRLEFLPYLSARCELPETFSAFRQQQMRWCQGCAENLRKHFLSFFRGPLSFRQRAFAFLHLIGFSLMPTTVFAISVWVPLAFVPAGAMAQVANLAASALGACGALTLSLYLASQATLRRQNWLLAREIPGLIVLSTALMLPCSLAWCKGILGVADEFKRTPKGPAPASRGSSEAASLRWAASQAFYAAYLLAAAAVVFELGSAPFSIFIGFHAIGAAVAAYLEWRERRP